MGRKSEAANTSIWKEIVALTSATNYFISNVEHVKTLELEAILHLVCGYATSKQINSFSKVRRKWRVPEICRIVQPL